MNIYFINFLKLLKTDRPLRYHNNYPILRINNNLIVKKLIKIGCKPGNSLNNSYPKFMPDKYFFHFLRGYIDGGGSIYICESKKSRQKNVLRVSIIGSKEFLQLLVKKISYYLNREINYMLIRNKKTKVPLHLITFNGELARLLCYKLYKDCGKLYLKRKREKFNIHIKQKNNDV